jgi:Serine/threonine protein kinase
MTTMFDRFEIQSELSKSDDATVYKAMDKETNQVVALKTQSLTTLGDRAAAFVESLMAEGEAVRGIASQNIVPVYGTGESNGQFSAAMEYIQGNSIATMLARKEGFSIWDLLDITRQLCAALEHAALNDVKHYSLEPAKIMVQWDGMVKILGYGISKMSLIGTEPGSGMGRLTPYCSPEQLRGEAIDLRSNLFTLGTILYEMVAGQRAFNASDVATLLGQIENEMPPSPSSLNPKIQSAVSDVVMKALAKDPAARYQHARELLDDLEKCKETGKKNVAEPKKITPPTNVAVDPAMRAAAASKFVSTGAGEPISGTGVSQPSAAPAPGTMARAAAAGAGSAAAPKRATVTSNSNPNSGTTTTSGARMISDFEVSAAPDSVQESPRHSAPLSTDPMMSEGVMSSAATGQVKSFSDLAEMPPLKEIVYAAPVPEPIEPSATTVKVYPKKESKPRVQPREAAQKAMKEISTIPPRLMLFSILGAVGLILVVAILIFFHVRSEDDGSTSAPRPVKSAPAPVAAPEPPPVVAEAPRERIAVAAEEQPDVSVRRLDNRAAKKNRRAVPVAAPVAAIGQALIDSDPAGAQIQIDGKSDAAWVTPFNVGGLSAGKHIVSASKSGYASEIRSLEVAAGVKASLSFRLSPMNALIVVTSSPAGAAITLDGKPTGHVTPAQFSADKGSHVVLLRKSGYLDETVTTDLIPGQNFQYAPVLRALGNVEEIKTVGKFNKLFGRGGESTAGMGALSIHTQPKGAQVVINQRLLDKTSPVDIMIGPGNYVVDITMTGFKPFHKVVIVDKGGKTAIDEILERQ